MGADLYIEEIHTPLRQRYGPLFEAAVRRRDQCQPGSKEAAAAQADVVKYYDLMYSAGYFRDSYNATSVLWRLGLSWWEDVIPLLTANRKLRQDKLRRFRDMVAQATLKLPTREELEQAHLPVTESGEDSLEDWHTYFPPTRAVSHPWHRGRCASTLITDGCAAQPPAVGRGATPPTG